MPVLKNEFAAVEIEVDEQANGPRLKITDLETNQTIYLDPLELENLTWVPHRALEPLMDPSAYRWKGKSKDKGGGPGTFYLGESAP